MGEAGEKGRKQMIRGAGVGAEEIGLAKSHHLFIPVLPSPPAMSHDRHASGAEGRAREERGTGKDTGERRETEHYGAKPGH